MSEDNFRDDSRDKGDLIQRFLYRITPYWPLVVIAIVLAIAGAKIYLRYQVPVFIAKARVIVNDETEQKSANLQEIFKLDTRNLSSETEKEIQILTSRDLLTKVAIKLQLNVIYLQKGRIRTAQYYGNQLPFKLELETPDSVKKTISGAAELINNTIVFDGNVYPVDSVISSKFGNVKWVINREYKSTNPLAPFHVSIIPISGAVGVLKSSLQIAPISKLSSILDVTYNDAIQERAVAILNNLFSIYGTSAVDYKSRIFENSQRFLDRRLSIVADELNGVEKNLQSYKTTEGIVDLSREGELFLGQVKDSDKKIAEIEVQLEVLNQINTYVTKRNNTSDPIPATLGINDPVLNGLLNQLYQTETELGKIRETSGNKNPQIEVLEEVIKRLKPGIITSINNLRINMNASRKSLVAQNNIMMASLNRIPVKERLLLDISRQQAIKNAIYTFLLQKREESAIAAASIVPNYRLIERPEKGGIISPEPKKIQAIAFSIATILFTIFIYLKEFAGKKLLFRSQIEESVPLPVIGELVYQDHAPESPIVVGAGKRTLIAEQFRELRTNIKFITSTSNKQCKVLLLTSSIPQEGKSFVAINTAISISLTGDKVVLLEFDMRKPKISKPMGITTKPGLSNFLVGDVSVEEIIKPHSTIENLFIIPAGPIPPNPAELLTDRKLTELFTYLREKFDYVLIDSPPVAAVTDAKILSSMADATIYIIRHNFTNYVFLNLLNDIYQKKGLTNINIVFNGIKDKKILGYGYAGYGYGYGYGYNYGYGYTVEDSPKTSFFRRIFSKI